jgi:hypothetical protein
MSQQNKTTLQTNINSQLADNTSGNISAADVRDNLINITDSLLFNSGSQSINGSLTVTSFTGSLQGTATTASYVQTAQTALFVQNAQTASYVLNAVSASFATTTSYALTASYVQNAQTSSFVNLLTQTVTINGLLIQTGSHAQGVGTFATGQYSHAEGNSTTSTGNFSHAEGDNAKSTGQYSHAEGNNTNAAGVSSHAEGYYTSASGNYSHAEGNNTNSKGTYSHAEGFGTIASGSYQHVQGQYNTQGDSTSLMIIGNGTTSSRKDAFKVRMSGSIVLPTTQSSSPSWTGTDGEMIFATVTGNHRFYVWMAGAWRSGSLA